MTSEMFRPAAMLLMLVAAPAAAQTTAVDTAYRAGAFQVFTGAGASTTVDPIVAAMRASQVVFIGETHDDPTAHMLELELLRRAHAEYGGSRPIVLSLEFFERDVQLPLDEYLAGRISELSFRRDARPWPRYQTDYRPLIEFAREHGIPVVAANAPRRYVSKVTMQGRQSLDELSAAGRALLAPLPYGSASAAYREQWIATMSRVMEMEGMKCGVPVERPAAAHGAHQNMGHQLDSQVLWDATMAHSIARALEERPGALVLHMAGGFHVERGTGTPEHLQAYAPGTRALIVAVRPVQDVTRFEAAPGVAWGDFVVQTERARTLEALECRGKGST